MTKKDLKKEHEALKKESEKSFEDFLIAKNEALEDVTNGLLIICFVGGLCSFITGLLVSHHS